jgi:transposase-like protein
MTTRRTRSERAEIVRAYRASKQTAYRFSQDQGVSASSLARWIAEVKEQGDERAGVDFVRLEVARAEPRDHLVVEVGGARVQVERGFDAKLLRAVVDALGSQS